VDHRLTAKKEAYETLRTFCFSFALGMFILTTAFFITHNFHHDDGWLLPQTLSFPWYAWIPAGLSLAHLFFGFVNRSWAKPTHALIGVIGQILTAILMGAFYYLLFTPIVLLTRLFGKDLIHQGSKEPHWEEVPEDVNNPKQIEKLF
jgi:uncharacterized membrane protein YdcZ (DUF606 family)